MGHCNHSLLSSIYHSPHFKHSLSPLLDFSWYWTITSSFVPLNVKGFLVYHRLEKFCTAISSVIDLSNKFVDQKGFTDGWCLMDIIRLNYFIWFRQAHSNNRWHKFNGSIRKFLGCMDHKLAWLYFSENNVIHWDFAMVYLIVEPAQWLIQDIVPANSWKINPDQNWVSIPSLHKTTLVNDLPHSVSTVSIIFFRQLMLFYYGLSFWSPRLNFYSLSRLLHL